MEDVVIMSATPVLYTMTAGSLATSGRLLLYSASNSFIRAGLNKDQAERSGLGTIPIEYTLDQNYPNPFNPTTTIRFVLAEPSIVTLQLYNTLGQKVTTLIHNGLLD